MRRILFICTILFLTTTAYALDDPVAVELHYQSGVKFFKRGLYDRATVEFERTLALDSKHEEAKAYLEEIKARDARVKSVDAKQSKDKEVQNLYRQGRELYGKRDFQAAKEVFEKILTLKPVDDFASFYKERCEIFISRKLAKEKKIQEKEQLKEQKKQERLDCKKEKEMKVLQRQAMLAQRAKGRKERLVVKEVAAEIKEEKREEKRTSAVTKEEQRELKLQVRQEKIDARRQAKEERKFAAVARREEKQQIKEAKREEKRIARETVLEERAEKKQERKDRKKEVLKNKEEALEQKKERTEELKNIKEMFLKGVEQYGHKDYVLAIATFQDVINAELASEKTYSRAAGRLMDKAKNRLKQLESAETTETESP
ncbi:MAG: hypothetical protein V1863_01815 [Candidatus Omnitrophota bacterium]